MTEPCDHTTSWSLRLAELLCARLCHDLASPLGSLGGALEMIADDPGNATEALDIAQDAAAALAGRLKLLRAAWSDDCGALGTAEIVALTTAYPVRRLRLDLAGLTGTYSAPVARVLLNLILLGIEALPGGGTLVIVGSPQAGVTISPAGPRAGWPAGLASLVAGGDVVLPRSPRDVLPPFTVLLARDAGLRLSMPESPEGAASLVLSRA